MPSLKIKVFLKKEYLILAIVLLISIFFRFYLLEERFPFGWDQERDAQVMWRILKEGRPTLIGPSAAGIDTFFLGPLWYYLLLPFYFIFNMDPIAAAYFASLAGVVTTLIIFFLVKNLFGLNQALLASLLWATLPDRISWNPMLIPLATSVIFFTLYKISQGFEKFIPITFLLIGLSLQIHFQSVFFFPTLIISLYFYKKKKFSIPFNYLGLGLLFLALTFLPLLVFDLRHDFINIGGFLKLFFQGEIDYSSNLLYRLSVTLNNSIRFAHFTLFPRLFSFEFSSGIIITILSILGIQTANISKQIKLMLLSLLLLPPIITSFYKGDISEYYFTISALPIIVGLTLLAWIIYSKSLPGKIVIITVVVLLIGWRVSNFISGEFYSDYLKSNLSYKKQAVLYIVNQKIDPIFNVSYSTRPNDDAGFHYLFKFYGREPQNIPAGHLWTIVMPSNRENVPPIATFGDIGIIRR